MLKESFKFSLKILAIIIGYFVLSMYIDPLYIVIGALAITIPLTIYNMRTKSDFSYILEAMCNPNKYIETVHKKYIKKDENVYQTYLAYAYVYQGDYEKAALAIDKIDRSIIEKTSKLNFKYQIVLLKLAYNNKNIKKYKLLYEELQKIELDDKETIDIKNFEVPIYILEKRYKEVIVLLTELIPNQKKRYYLMELEYYLALAYIKVNRKEDAIAVLEFISNKRFSLIYNELGRKLLEKIN